MRTLRVMRRRGFTLIETIVTVGIVATLAAVVVPEVVKQFDTSEPTRVQQDLKNLATAIQTFNVNVKSMPGDFADLTTPITTTDTTITATGQTAVFTTTQTGYWNGPYIDVPLVEAVVEATRETGSAGKIHDDFVCYNATDNAEASNGLSGDQDCPTATIAATDRLFLAIRLTGLGANDAASFIAINDLFDGTTETTGTDRATKGRVRHVNVGGTVNTVYFLVSPIN